MAPALLLLAACLPAGTVSNSRQALAIIEARSGSTVQGSALFSQYDDQVALQLFVTNATPGSHAVHIHETGDCSAADASSAGGHWNPNSASHGDPASTKAPAHLGDLGNLDVGPDGTGSLRVTRSSWALVGDGSDVADVVGHAIVVHANTDDFTTQPAGNAGGRVGCGVIRLLDSDVPTNAAPNNGVGGTTGRSVTVNLFPRSASSASGTATFTQQGSKVHLEVKVANVSPGSHGIHLHQYGDCSAADGTSTGGHWNPSSVNHGGPTAAAHHAGDLGNIEVGADGKGTLNFDSSEWVVDAALVAGKRATNDVIGRGIILHAKVDDLITQPTGNAGDRIACGAIGVDTFPTPTAATARMDARSGSSSTGTASFAAASGGGVTLTLNMTNLTPGMHAVHLHDKGDCSAFDATSTGGHWNPTNMAHGAPTAAAHHVGDVGNLMANANGTGTLTFTQSDWAVVGEKGVVGHAVIVHAAVDDFVTQPTGNAGGRISCGVITLDNQQPKPPRKVMATLEAKSGTATTGLITLTETGDRVTLNLDVLNATVGQHGVRLHLVPDCSAADGASAGAAWTPVQVGDLGNLTVAAGGRGTLTVSNPYWFMGDGGTASNPVDVSTAADGGLNALPDGGVPRFEVLGRALIIQAGAAGEGNRVSCGVLK
ncbi:MAG: superoxide dismutase family protein [Myxococcaceae bacterium]